MSLIDLFAILTCLKWSMCCFLRNFTLFNHLLTRFVRGARFTEPGQPASISLMPRRVLLDLRVACRRTFSFPLHRWIRALSQDYHHFAKILTFSVRFSLDTHPDARLRLANFRSGTSSAIEALWSPIAWLSHCTSGFCRREQIAAQSLRSAGHRRCQRWVFHFLSGTLDGRCLDRRSLPRCTRSFCYTAHSTQSLRKTRRETSVCWS